MWRSGKQWPSNDKILLEWPKRLSRPIIHTEDFPIRFPVHLKIAPMPGVHNKIQRTQKVTLLILTLCDKNSG
jgi:hypothetical protein